MDQRRLRRYGRAVILGINLPRPFSARALCKVIAEQRGRPLHLHALSGQSGRDAPCGTWIATEVADHIFYEEDTSPYHQDHIILHELGHMLCNHRGSDIAAQPGISEISDNVDPGTARKFLFRTSYTTYQEQSAEMVASLILEQANRLQHEPVGAYERWLGSALGAVND